MSMGHYSWEKPCCGVKQPAPLPHTLVSNPCRRFILCMLRSLVAWHVIGSAHEDMNHPLSPSRSRSPSYQPERRNGIDTWKRKHVICLSLSLLFDVCSFNVKVSCYGHQMGNENQCRRVCVDLTSSSKQVFSPLCEEETEKEWRLRRSTMKGCAWNSKV